jgi:hypothetical protein
MPEAAPQPIPTPEVEAASRSSATPVCAGEAAGTGAKAKSRKDTDAFRRPPGLKRGYKVSQLDGKAVRPAPKPATRVRKTVTAAIASFSKGRLRAPKGDTPADPRVCQVCARRSARVPEAC